MHNIVRRYALNVAIFNILLEATVEQAMQNPQVRAIVEARKKVQELREAVQKIMDDLP